MESTWQLFSTMVTRMGLVFAGAQSGCPKGKPYAVQVQGKVLPRGRVRGVDSGNHTGKLIPQVMHAACAFGGDGHTCRAGRRGVGRGWAPLPSHKEVIKTRKLNWTDLDVDWRL